MASSVPNNSKFSVAATYAAPIAVSAASNASECVLTTANNTYAVGDILEFSSGWTRANLRLFRVKTASATSVTLEGFDTTSTKLYPVGAGAGSLRKVMTWTVIPFVKGFEPSGGDAKYNTEEYLDYPDEVQVPNGFSAASITMTITDDPAQPFNAVLQAATDSQAITAIRMELASGAPLLYNGYLSFNPMPTMAKGQNMTVKCGIALQSRMTRYAA